MTKEQVFELMRNNPVFALATAENNIPHVRMMMLYRADENGILFNTGENKDLHTQLQANPEVELCFFDTNEVKHIRVTGSVEMVEDPSLKREIGNDYQFLKKWVDSAGYDVLVVYRLKRGKATMWTMETNFKPKEYIQL